EARADGRVPAGARADAVGAESEPTTASAASTAGTAAEGPSQSEHSTASDASTPSDGSSQSGDPTPSEGSGPAEDSTQGGASGQGEPKPGDASGDSTTDCTLRSSNPRNNDGGRAPKHGADPATAASMTTELEPQERKRLWFELGLVAALSLGQASVYAIVRLADIATRGPISEAQAKLNTSLSSRPGFDLVYQLLDIGF